MSSQQGPPSRPWFRLTTMVRPPPPPPPAPTPSSNQGPPPPRPTFIRPTFTPTAPQPTPTPPPPQPTPIPPSQRPIPTPPPQQPNPIPPPQLPSLTPPAVPTSDVVEPTSPPAPPTTISTPPTTPPHKSQQSSPPVTPPPQQSSPPKAVIGSPSPSSTATTSPITTTRNVTPPSSPPKFVEPPEQILSPLALPLPLPLPPTNVVTPPTSAPTPPSPRVRKTSFSIPPPSPPTKSSLIPSPPHSRPMQLSEHPLPPSSPPKIIKTSPTVKILSPLVLPSHKHGSSNETPQEYMQKTMHVQETKEKPKITSTNGFTGRHISGIHTHNSTRRHETHKKNLESEDSGKTIITISGENRGAIMKISPFSDAKRQEFGNNTHINRNNPSTSSNEDKSQMDSYARNKKNNRKSKSLLKTAFLNNNVQGVNNSILCDSSINHHDPGIHLTLSTISDGDHGIRSEESKKGEHDMIP